MQDGHVTRPVSATRRGGLRLFAGPVDEPRARRATDVIALVLALGTFSVLTAISSPVPRIEAAVSDLLAAFPQVLDSVWALLVRLPWPIAILVTAATLVQRRWHLARDLVAAVVVSTGLVLVGGRLAEGSWLTLSEIFRYSTPISFPVPPLVVAAAVLWTANPHLARPLRRLVTRLVWLAALAATFLPGVTPGRSLAAMAAAAASAAIVHLALGSVRGRPGLGEVEAALAELGVEARDLGVADRQQAGDFVVEAQDATGQPLIVKVFGRDANDTQLLNVAWRSAWYRETGAPPTLGRLHQVEHEALLTLLAARAGVDTYEVVTAGADARSDALLVLRPVGQPMNEEGAGPWEPPLVDAMWAVLNRLHDSGMTHGNVEGRNMFRVHGDGGPRVGLSDFRGASVTASVEYKRRDQAQLLVSSLIGGSEALAIDAARRGLGDEDFTAMLPFLQIPVLTTAQRRAVRSIDLDLDELRQRVAETLGQAAPELQQLRRVSVGSLLQAGLLVFAFLTLARVVGGVDFTVLREEVANAQWWMVGAAFMLAQVPRLAHAISALGASPVRVALKPLYLLQLATAYLGLVIPSSAGRIALNIRFFQRQGLRRGTAMAIGAIDGFAGFLVQVATMTMLLAFTSATLDIDLDFDLGDGAARLLLWVVGFGVVAIAVVFGVPSWRERILEQARNAWAEANEALTGLVTLRRLGMLFGGNLASDVFLSLALGLFAMSLGYSLGLGELIVIVVGVSLLAGIMPVPGGIGVTEGGLIFGLASAGIPEDVAFAVVIVYRLASFYVPPVWGFFSMKWLERNAYI